MDKRLSELPNRISTQDLTHRSSGNIHGHSLPAQNLAGNSAKLSSKVRLVNKVLTVTVLPSCI